MKSSYIFLIILIAHVLFSCASNSSKDEIKEEIIYISNNGRNIDVFNIDELYFSEEGVEYLNRRDYEYGEFGGQIEFCSNVDYYCVVGGVGAAVPKKINGQKEWQIEDWKCQAETPISLQKPTVITCDYKGKLTHFTYSPEKGITHYFLSNPNVRFELIGDKGLLAPN